MCSQTRLVAALGSAAVVVRHCGDDVLLFHNPTGATTSGVFLFPSLRWQEGSGGRWLGGRWTVDSTTCQQHPPQCFVLVWSLSCWQGRVAVNFPAW